MQETLLTLRGIHRLTIAGCVTVMLLAMTPSLAHRYQSALDELTQAEADFAEYHETHYALDGPSEEDLEIAALVRQVLVDDLPKQLQTGTNWSFRADIDDRALPRLDASLAIVQRLDQPPEQMPLSAIHELGTNPAWNRPLQIVVPDHVDLRQQLLAVLLEKIPKYYKQLSTDTTARELVARVTFSQTHNVDDFDGRMGFMVECGLDDEKSLPLGIGVVAATSHEIIEMPSAYPLQKTFPECRRVWSEVHDLTVTEAAELVRRRKADTTADVTVMGFRFPKHIALLLGPLVTAILFLYLQLHVKHAIPRMQRHGWEAQDFPWIAFYLDRASKLVTVFTFVYLPLVSCGMLTHSEWTLSGQFPWIIAGCTLFCACSGIITLARIRHLPSKTESALDEAKPEIYSIAA